MLLTLLPFIVYVVVFLAMCAAVVLIIHSSVTAEERRQSELEARADGALRPPHGRVLDNAA